AEGIGGDLAVLGREERGERVPALIDQVADLEHDVGPLAERGRSPRGERGAGGRDRGVDIPGRGEIDVLGDVPERRVIHIATTTRGPIDEATGDPVLDATRFGARGGFGFSDLGHGSVLVSGVDPPTIRQNGGRVSGSGQAGAVPRLAADRRGSSTPTTTARTSAPTETSNARRPPAGKGPATTGSRHTVVTAARARHQAAIATSKRVPSRVRKTPSELASNTM